MNQITNVREMPQEQKSTARKVWENLQYLNLALTIGGQVVIGGSYLIGQGAWLVANLIAVARDIILKRPAADVVKDVAMTALTAGLIIFYLLGVSNVGSDSAMFERVRTNESFSALLASSNLWNDSFTVGLSSCYY